MFWKITENTGLTILMILQAKSVSLKWEIVPNGGFQNLNYSPMW